MMSAIQTIVAGSDFSFHAHRAARRAGLLAKRHGAALQLVHVINAASLLSLETGGLDPNLAAALQEDARRGLASLNEDVIAAGGVQAEQTVLDGATADQLLAAASNAQVFVLGPRGTNPLKDFLIGSTAERVARAIPTPLLVVKQDPQRAYDTVLVPVDFSPLSTAALRFARTLAPEAKIYAYHAYYRPPEELLLNVGLSETVIRQQLAQVPLMAQRNMEQLITELADSNIQPLIEQADPRNSIVSQAQDQDCQLIVLAKQGRSWLSDLVMGSVTRRVLEHAACDVLVVPGQRTTT